MRSPNSSAPRNVYFLFAILGPRTSILDPRRASSIEHRISSRPKPPHWSATIIAPVPKSPSSNSRCPMPYPRYSTSIHSRTLILDPRSSASIQYRASNIEYPTSRMFAKSSEPNHHAWLSRLISMLDTRFSIPDEHRASSIKYQAVGTARLRPSPRRAICVCAA